MTEFTITEAKAFHCGQMCRLLRHEHRQALALIGVNSHQELTARFEQSSFRRSWMIDGKLAALGGVTGSPLSSEGFVWLAVSNAATKYPKAIVREARKQLAEIMQTKRELMTAIIDDDETSKRFALFMGFVPTIHLDPQPYWLMAYVKDGGPQWHSSLH